MVASHTFEELQHELAQDEESDAARVFTYHLHGTSSLPIGEHLPRIQALDEYFMEMKKAL
jgi:hypothetical protein